MGTDLERLLVVQDHDLHLDQLRHRREHLPERAELEELLKRRGAVAASRDEIARARDAVADRQASAETDIATAEKRIHEIEERMRSGAITASRDLQAMQGEVDSIRQRLSGLEDDALTAMDEREPLDAQVDGFDEQLRAVDELAEQLRSTIASAESDVDAERIGEEATRASAADGIDPALLATYEKLRARLGGIGAARLEGSRCAGCHLALSASELEQVRKRAPDEVAYCEQCGRILVRTD